LSGFEKKSVAYDVTSYRTTMPGMDTKFRVKEFADLAGVTVRTLQYYDRLGLLKPSGYKNGNHRLYQIEDLLRLQQVLTFKYLGYGLDDIRKLMDSPDYDVRDALKTQRKAIADRISQLQKVAKSLDRTASALESIKMEGVDWKVVREVIAGIVRSERWEWVQEYYTPEQKKILKQRGRNVTAKQLAQWQMDWSEVLVGFQRLMDRGSSPGDSESQRIAGKMEVLVQGFTKGDKGIEQSLGRAYSNMERVSKDQRPFSIELQQYMAEACAIHRTEKK
jgi:MerR family transcriptional regulator, thiopeptide resistance regulator